MRKILVAIDGSPREAKIVRAARELAERAGARLIFFRAVALPVDLPRAAFAISPDSVGELLLKEAQARVRAAIADVPPALVADVRVGLGAPWQAICDEAKRDEVDLIAIGSHGYGGLDRLLGTTAAKVVNHADRSVLVIK